LLLLEEIIIFEKLNLTLFNIIYLEMKNKLNYSTLAFGLFFVFSGPVNAQSSIVSTGGELIGSGGSASITVGQVHYESVSSGNGASFGGVQQAYELFEIKTWKDVPYWNEPNEPGLPIRVNLTLFPNPTPRAITIRVTDYNNEVLNYRILDVLGREMLNGVIGQSEVTIDVEKFPEATYYMEVKQGERASVYKLVKSN
jgi:hypothetical protein